MKNLPFALIGAISFIWLGALAAISFIEAPLKFQAPGVTILIGVGMGNLVFHALNQLEIILLLLVLAFNFFSTRKKANLLLILLIGVLLALQIGYLMPKLDARIALMWRGMELHSNSLHFYYAACEILKMLLLLILGIRVMISLLKHSITPDY